MHKYYTLCNKQVAIYSILRIFITYAEINEGVHEEG